MVKGALQFCACENVAYNKGKMWGLFSHFEEREKERGRERKRERKRGAWG